MIAVTNENHQSRKCPSRAEAKRRLRRLVLARRSAAAEGSTSTAGERIAAVGHELLEDHDKSVISGYWPMRHEIDCRPLLAGLHQAGWQVGLPCIEEHNAPLVFRRWSPGAPLVKGVFETSEPHPDAAVLMPEVLLMPLVAFDRDGFRLGYGGGYYDRTIARLAGGGSITTIGLAYDEQEVVIVPRETHDQRLDWVLTPSGARTTRT